ncbi:hypothetical protein [Streptomyces pratensis]|nr:hypothetical protein [Streptomyces pratensis]
MATEAYAVRSVVAARAAVLPAPSVRTAAVTIPAIVNTVFRI